MHVKKRPLAWHLAATALATLAWAGTAQAAAVVSVLPDNSTAAADTLVQTLLGAAGGVAVVPGSVLYTGAATASGTFSNGMAGAPNGLGITSGVVLSTGDARFIGSSAAFPGDAANSSGTFTAGVGNALTPNNTAGDALFNTLTSAPSFNASVLSFDFVPQQDRLTLRFVFASEDYSDLVNAGFPTDVLGIFVNGVNQALVPGSNQAISAASVHCGGPTSGPAPGIGGLNCDLYRDNAPFFDSIDSEADGFTTVFDLSMAVQPGVVNRIAIGVADALDTSGDSAVLLAAGSLTAVPEPSSAALVLVALAACGAAARRAQTGRTTGAPQA